MKSNTDWKVIFIPMFISLLFIGGCSSISDSINSNIIEQESSKPSSLISQSLIDINYKVIALVMTDTYSLAYYKKTAAYPHSLPNYFYTMGNNMLDYTNTVSVPKEVSFPLDGNPFHPDNIIDIVNSSKFAITFYKKFVSGQEQLWATYSNTSAQPWTKGREYRVNMRGRRMSDLLGITVNNNNYIVYWRGADGHSGKVGVYSDIRWNSGSEYNYILPQEITYDDIFDISVNNSYYTVTLNDYRGREVYWSSNFRDPARQRYLNSNFGPSARTY